MLRTAATTHFYTSEQVRVLVKLVEYRSRVDAVVMLFRRVVDPDKFVERVYFLLKEDETKMLRSRLGPGLAPMLPAAELAKDKSDAPPAAVFLTEQDPFAQQPAAA